MNFRDFSLPVRFIRFCLHFGECNSIPQTHCIDINSCYDSTVFLLRTALSVASRGRKRRNGHSVSVATYQRWWRTPSVWWGLFFVRRRARKNPSSCLPQRRNRGTSKKPAVIISYERIHVKPTYEFVDESKRYRRFSQLVSYVKRYYI